MSSPVRLKGFDGLNRKLKRLPRGMRGQALRQALRSGAKVIEREAKSRVSVLSGKLKRNLTTKVHEDKAGNQHAVIGANWPDGAHIHLVEFGTSNRALKGSRVRGRGKRKSFVEYAYPAGTNRGSMPAKPFLRPAFDARHPAALNEMAKHLDRVLSKLVR